MFSATKQATIERVMSSSPSKFTSSPRNYFKNSSSPSQPKKYKPSFILDYSTHANELSPQSNTSVLDLSTKPKRQKSSEYSHDSMPLNLSNHGKNNDEMYDDAYNHANDVKKNEIGRIKSHNTVDNKNAPMKHGLNEGDKEYKEVFMKVDLDASRDVENDFKKKKFTFIDFNKDQTQNSFDSHNLTNDININQDFIQTLCDNKAKIFIGAKDSDINTNNLQKNGINNSDIEKINGETDKVENDSACVFFNQNIKNENKDVVIENNNDNDDNNINNNNDVNDNDNVNNKFFCPSDYNLNKTTLNGACSNNNNQPSVIHASMNNSHHNNSNTNATTNEVSCKRGVDNNTENTVFDGALNALRSNNFYNEGGSKINSSEKSSFEQSFKSVLSNGRLRGAEITIPTSFQNASTHATQQQSPCKHQTSLSQAKTQILLLNGKEYEIVHLGGQKWISKNEFELLAGLNDSFGNQSTSTESPMQGINKHSTSIQNATVTTKANLVALDKNLSSYVMADEEKSLKNKEVFASYSDDRDTKEEVSSTNELVNLPLNGDNAMSNAINNDNDCKKIPESNNDIKRNICELSYCNSSAHISSMNSCIDFEASGEVDDNTEAKNFIDKNSIIKSSNRAKKLRNVRKRKPNRL